MLELSSCSIPLQIFDPDFIENFAQEDPRHPKVAKTSRLVT
jgi:hypothetical protein